jgi:hypothetical protein
MGVVQSRPCGTGFDLPALGDHASYVLALHGEWKDHGPISFI